MYGPFPSLHQSPAWENLISLVRSVTSSEALDCGGYVKCHWDTDSHSSIFSHTVRSYTSAQAHCSLLAWDLLTSDKIFWHFTGQKVGSWCLSLKEGVQPSSCLFLSQAGVERAVLLPGKDKRWRNKTAEWNGPPQGMSFRLRPVL